VWAPASRPVSALLEADPATPPVAWRPNAAAATGAVAEEEPAAEPKDWRPSQQVGDRRRFSPQQELAVHAYCAELCEPAAARAAAEEALSSVAAQRHDADGRERNARLLRSARIAAAAHSSGLSPHLRTVARGPAKRSKLAAALAPDRDGACTRTPALLAAQANDELGDEDARALSQHLGDCLRCRAAEARAGRAERAFLAAADASAFGLSAPAPSAAEPLRLAAANGAAAAPTRRGRTAPWPAVLAGLRARGSVVVAAALCLLVGAIVAVALVAGGGGSSAPATSSAPTIAATPPTPTAPVATHPARRLVHKAKAKPRHHAAPKPHPIAVAAAPASAAAPAAVSSSSTPAASAAPPPPSTPAPQSSTPPPTTQSSQSSSTFVQQGSSLGTASAPTQHVGSGSGKH
jgi:hypothetical protein